MKLTMTIETITPDIAAAWLEQNPNNRNLRETKATEFGRSMSRGEWPINGESIKFNGNGDLIDGQHRLWGCVLSGCSFQSLVVRGLDVATQATIDNGTKRTMGDTLKWMGEADGTMLGSVLRVLALFYETGEIRTQGALKAYTKGELIEILNTHEGIRECITFPHKKQVAPLLTKSIGAVMFYLFYETGWEDTTVFYEKLATGADLSEGDPILALRTSLLTAKSKLHSNMETRHRAALTIKAFNFWRRGWEAKRLYWRAGGAKAEKFPRIDGYDYSFLDNKKEI